MVSRLAAATYRRAYAAIATLMGVTIVVAGIFFLLDSTGHRPFSSWLFWVEVILLALFAVFWVFQTAENWDVDLPDGLPWGGVGEPVQSET